MMTPESAARGEFEWIARLVEILGDPARAVIGDDTAIVEASGGPWAWTVDSLVEGVHFRFDWLDPEAVGRRALVASLSDLAAAGAEPAGALVAVAGPGSTIAGRIEGIYAGLRAAGEAAGCPVLGGDLARSDGPLHVTVTALGRVAGGPPLSRSGARPGDEIWLTGALGGPAAAVAILASASDGSTDAGSAHEVPRHPRAHAAYERFADPRARGPEIRWLRDRAEIHAAIDVSDGLSGDLHRLAERSGVRIVIEPDRVPLHGGAVAAARALGADPSAWALHGGEEFELVLVAPPGALEPLSERFAARFAIPLTRIGIAQRGEGVWTSIHGREEPLPAGSWDHFAPGSA